MKKKSAVGSYLKAIGNINSSLITAFKGTSEKQLPRVEVSVPENPSESGLYTCGFAKKVLLPEDDVSNYCIAGYNIGQKLHGVYDPCYAKAVWLDDNSGLGGVVLIALDVIGVSRCDIDVIKQRLAAFCKQTGCRSVNVMSTHNHETIDTLGPWGELAKMTSGRVDEYMEKVFDAAVEAAATAYANRTDGTLHYGVIDVEPRKTDDGKYIMWQDDSRYPYETMTTMARFRFAPADESKNEIYIINYAAHAEALMGGNRLMSADFPGVMCQRIKDFNGADAMFINGAIGGLVMPGFFFNHNSDAVNLSAEQLKAVPEALREYFTADADNENSGYPVLSADLAVCGKDDETTVFISDERQLKAFADAVNSGVTMSGITVRMTDDIDLDGTPLCSIGTLEKRFRGVFDGCGHSIYGLVINGGENTGLFAALGKDAVIANLTIADGIIRGGKNTGSFAGYVDNGAEIVNCSSGATLSGSNRTGGIVGYVCDGSIVRCCFTGSVSGNASQIGGIAGLIEKASVTACYNKGCVKSADNTVGGIVGEATDSFISKCYNSATVFSLMCRNSSQIAGRLNGESGVSGCFGDSNVSVCPAVSLTRVGNDGPISIYDQMEHYGAFLAGYACTIKDKPLEASVGIVKVNDNFKIKNIVLTFAALSGLINNKASRVKNPHNNKSSLTVDTGLTYLKIGCVNVLMLPGEIFTELVTGAFLDDIHAGNPGKTNPIPLAQIFGDDGMRIFGLVNDEIGYIVPPNDFVLDSKLAYINPGRDRNGKIHYEETNSLGPDTAYKIAELAAIAKEAMDGASK